MTGAELSSTIPELKMSYGMVVGFSAPVDVNAGPMCFMAGWGCTRSVSEFSNTAETLIVGEFPNIPVNNAIFMRAITSQTRLPGAVHFDGSNVLFADYHVKWMKPEKINGPGGPSNTPYYYWLKVKP